VAKAVEAAVRLDVQMLTIHTSGGLAMMQSAQQSAEAAALRTGKSQPLILGVTVLTSLNTNDLAEVGIPHDVGDQVERLANLAALAGLGGLVCSPLEITRLREFLPSKIQLVTPGIRPADSVADDQKRTLTPKEALAAGASWLVIGRPICAAPNPRAAAEAILASL
jgi:orotidine-5'-phosphate decarboxylase